MKRVRGYHFLFGATLLALAALVGWWTVYLKRSVELSRKAQMNELVHATVVAALMIGHGEARPRPGKLSGPAPLEIVPTSETKKGSLFAPTVPRYPDMAVRPEARAISAVEKKVGRRHLMVIGEGSFLFVLLGILTFMLYRMIVQERRHMRHMQAFVASVSHEMKTPLAGIKSLLQTMAAGRVPARDQARLFAMGIKEAERLEHMIENVLISGNLRRGGLTLQRARLELRELIEAFIEHRRSYQIDMPDAIFFRWEPDTPEALVMGDSHAIHTILENLVDNAFKYGGDSPRAEIVVRRESGRVTISVEDQGVGFPSERAADLFVPFKRVIEGKSSAQHGSGLGLSIARALAMHMGGELTAESDGPGRGSRFTLSLEEAV
ncbi:MAG TPA: HAMP domain-containing sensor histidine kinase [Myxococcota bacterium]|nr:HAMP domain-containing sensor histidine kinase [Myxococcota bacterium]